MKKANVLFLFLFILLPIQSQNKLKYTYDAAGNRIKKEIIISPSTRSANVELSVYEEQISERTIKIYPNPTKGNLQIDISGGDIPKGSLIQIYNMSGALVSQVKDVVSTNKLDISSYPQGIYILRITLDKDNKTSWRIIKE